MVYINNSMGIPHGHFPPPTQLPDDFASRVMVSEIIDSHIPGYVYLKHPRYILAECGDEGHYMFSMVESSEGCVINRAAYLSSRLDMHGPALYNPGTKNVLPSDTVYCMRCLLWPPQAADWPTRRRDYDWPGSATLGRVVSNGCDVVGAVHRLCRQDEWMNTHQWRLSFSRAEVTLISGWLPVQQIVYHMLRIFVKTEQLTDPETSSLSNYHIKTLMLWSCELKSTMWWTSDLSVVGVCVELLHGLAAWLTDKRCPHYFISNCNLLDNLFNAETTAYRLLSLNGAWLSKWFLNNYIRKCSQLCRSFQVTRLFTDVSTTVKLQDAVSAVVAWQRNAAIYILRSAFTSEQYYITETVSSYSLTVRSCNYWIAALSKCDARLLIYFTATALLHIARRATQIGVVDDHVMDVLAVILGQFIGSKRCLKSRPTLLLAQATKLMKDLASNSRSTVQLIDIELSKAYLYRALRCKDSDSIYCLANVYLAVLYYTTGQYQTAIDHCTMVTRSQDHSQCRSQVVQGEILPKIDNAIDSVSGVAVFYQYVRTRALSQQRRPTQHVCVFTTELFAHLLHLRCLSTKNPIHMSMMQLTRFPQSFPSILAMKQLFIADVLIMQSISRALGKGFYHSSSPSLPHCYRNPTVPSTTRFISLLQQSAVEYLTTVRKVEARDFGSVDAIVTTDFEAMYACKRGDYQWCLECSEENVRTLLPAVSSGDEVSTFPEFIQLLDDDFVCLTALMLIINPLCRKTNVIISRLTLSLYLMTQCQLKLRHSMTSLAQTLDYIEMARAKFPPSEMLNHLVLKLTKRKALLFIKELLDE